jgi:3-oxoacyl-(acyl-carrier-protein) synthase
MDSKVWITGVGAVTALGFDFTTVAESLLAGRSAARLIHDRNPGEELLSPGCMLDHIPTPAGMGDAEFQRMSSIDQASLACCLSAIGDSGWAAELDGLRVGLVLGTGGEWLRHWEMTTAAGASDCHDGADSSSLLHRTHARLGINGPATLVAAACASGNFALAVARNWIRQNRVDICIAAGVEMSSPVLRARRALSIGIAMAW